MQQIDDIATGKAFPGVDLALWLRLIVIAVTAVALGVAAVAAL
ncbi:MAG TPA: hypothetical protein VHA79_11460 [Mycobacteriales bacterium]|nr:hypothetical protein [Mycobacteriales bacterium]